MLLVEPCRQRCLQVHEEEEMEQEPEKKVQEDIRPAASAINLCAKLSLWRGVRMGEGAPDPASKKRCQQQPISLQKLA